MRIQFTDSVAGERFAYRCGEKVDAARRHRARFVKPARRSRDRRRAVETATPRLRRRERRPSARRAGARATSAGCCRDELLGRGQDRAAAEPLTRAEAKTHLRVDSDITDQDLLIDG
jgi:hypothetical protein